MSAATTSVSAGNGKRKDRAESPDIPELKRARSIDFDYLLLDPDYQPVDIGTFALGDLLHLTVPFVKVHLSENHNVSVQSMYIVEEAHQFDSKPLTAVSGPAVAAVECLILNTPNLCLDYLTIRNGSLETKYIV
ncbi:hypothetical protein BKA62DRAFT_770718 [Auriculariales sp. MPI-PUGE-AT-0066]|nr:hypothetical protein BKA62DRAFT_770718 [Auriculariales sp. MPI-PUGE-AT-0066]